MFVGNVSTPASKFLCDSFLPEWLNKAETCSSIYYETIKCIFVTVCAINWNKIRNDTEVHLTSC